MRTAPLLAFTLFAALGAATPAQAPVQAASSGSIAVSSGWVFVLHDGVLYKFDALSMNLLARVRLADVAVAPPARREAVEEPLMEAEIVEEVVEEVIVEDEVFEPAARGRPQRAVETALQWLSRHQDEDGRWDSDRFMKHDTAGDPCDGAGRSTYDVGVTGLSLLALLGGGNTLRAGPHRDEVKKAVNWLREQQQENGLFGTNAAHDFVYGHAIAAFAVCEAYGLSDYTMLKPLAQKGIDYLESHRNPYGVWRYQPRDNDNDTSVTTWAWLAYRAATDHGLDVNPNVSKLVAVWYDQVTDEDGRAGYTKRGEKSSRMPGDHSSRFPPEKGEAMTAAALFGRFLLGQTPESNPVMKASADLMLAKPPRWDEKAGTIDPYYWFYGTLAMYQMGGHHWQQWNKELACVTGAQRRDGNFAGSWDPIGVWDCDGGRIYATALYALALGVSSRASKLVR